MALPCIFMCCAHRLRSESVLLTMPRISLKSDGGRCGGGHVPQRWREFASVQGLEVLGHTTANSGIACDEGSPVAAARRYTFERLRRAGDRFLSGSFGLINRRGDGSSRTSPAFVT